LPATRYQFGEWETARVNIDYPLKTSAARCHGIWG
jgi:hypothetical protein